MHILIQNCWKQNTLQVIFVLWPSSQYTTKSCVEYKWNFWWFFLSSRFLCVEDRYLRVMCSTRQRSGCSRGSGSNFVHLVCFLCLLVCVHHSHQAGNLSKDLTKVESSSKGGTFSLNYICKHNSPIYGKCRTPSVKALALLGERAHCHSWRHFNVFNDK